jgi:hypothetical protein
MPARGVGKLLEVRKEVRKLPFTSPEKQHISGKNKSPAFRQARQRHLPG